MTAPLPSRLIFLSGLRHAAPGSKVRFLGCVTKYSTKCGALQLQHAHTMSTSNTRSEILTAVVDISLLVETLKVTDTQIGEWVNVVGYVGEKVYAQSQAGVKVQALMLWSAGGVDLSEYRIAVQGRINSDL